MFLLVAFTTKKIPESCSYFSVEEKKYLECCSLPFKEKKHPINHSGRCLVSTRVLGGLSVGVPSTESIQEVFWT